MEDKGMALGQWYGALKIAEKRAPQGDVAMTEIMLVSQALLEAVARVAELEAALSRVVRAYDDYNQARTADFHNPECGCLQCAVDNAEALTKDPLMEGKGNADKGTR